MNRRRLQFSLRSLLVLTAVLAVLISIWLARPPAELRLTIRSGLANIDGRSVQLSSLPQELEKEREWRELWLRDCIVHLDVTDDIDIRAVLNTAADAGVGVQTVRFDTDATDGFDVVAVLKALADAKVEVRTARITAQKNLVLQTRTK